MDDSSKKQQLLDNPWGILYGVRPGKVVHKLFDSELALPDIRLVLKEKYLLSEDKIDLLLQLRSEETEVFDFSKEVEDNWGIYLGIPFCPSKCHYCSFFAHSSKTFKNTIEPFFRALLEEIRLTFQAFPSLKEKIDCLYIGGGTPACLGPDLTAELLDCLRAELKQLKEITFEGGRPELMEAELYSALQGKVDRICINPQSLNDRVLKINGRNHSAAETIRSFEQARSLGFNYINMDLIAGLPGDDFLSFKAGLQKMVELKPENITVHALAIKRASNLSKNPEMMAILDAQAARKMTDFASEFLMENNYRPYYCYRQRDILGGTENIGYTLPGYACRYNMMMISERMNIIGFGGGAASKFLFPWLSGREKIKRIANPRDALIYLNRGAKTNAERKFSSIEQILTRGEDL